MNIYKFRAERNEDVAKFHALGIATEMDTAKIKLPVEDILLTGYAYSYYWEVIFISRLTLPEIVELMQDIPDGHVMYQTVNYIDRYTGEREDRLFNARAYN